jgi:hypothetical protein
VRSALSVPIPKNAWLSSFLDRATPRPGTTELWFDAAADQNEERPPPVIVAQPTLIPLPLDVPLIIGVVLLVRRRKKARTLRA